MLHESQCAWRPTLSSEVAVCAPTRHDGQLICHCSSTSPARAAWRNARRTSRLSAFHARATSNGRMAATSSSGRVWRNSSSWVRSFGFDRRIGELARAEREIGLSIGRARARGHLVGVRVEERATGGGGGRLTDPGVLVLGRRFQQLLDRVEILAERGLELGPHDQSGDEAEEALARDPGARLHDGRRRGRLRIGDELDGESACFRRTGGERARAADEAPLDPIVRPARSTRWRIQLVLPWRRALASRRGARGTCSCRRRDRRRDRIDSVSATSAQTSGAGAEIVRSSVSTASFIAPMALERSTRRLVSGSAVA